MGPDHLLTVLSIFGVEEYKRFYYQDIQSIITCKTLTGKVWNIVLGICLGLFALLATGTDGGWSGFGFGMALVLAPFLIVHVLRGPTCDTFLQTAVHTEKLHSLSRIRYARRSMDRLKRAVEQVQGRLSPDIFRENILKQGRNVHQPDYSPRTGIAAQRLKGESGKIHALLFFLLTLDAILVMPSFFFTHMILTVLSIFAGLAMGISVIMALVKQSGSILPRSIQKITWVALTYICISFILGYVVSITLAFKNPEIAHNQWEMLKLATSMSPLDDPFLMGLHIFSISGSLLIGIPGLLMLNNHWKNKTG